jgi:GT2 family glycosyltransferase
VQPEENLGWCAAMNLGLRRAQELGLRYLLQLNADCEIESGALEALVDALEADAGVAGAMPLLHDGTRIWSAGSDLRFGPNQVKHRCHGLPLSEAPRATDARRLRSRRLCAAALLRDREHRRLR